MCLTNESAELSSDGTALGPTEEDASGAVPTREPLHTRTLTFSSFAFGNASCWDGSFSYEVVDQNGMTGFLNSDDNWKTDVADIDGARYIQVRMSFVSNPSTGLTPEVPALGLAWQE